MSDQVAAGIPKRVTAIDGDDKDHEQCVLAPMPLKMKKMKARRKVREPRFCFKTMSDIDILDDGYKWRKYGQKTVKNTQHPRYASITTSPVQPSYFYFTLPRIAIGYLEFITKAYVRYTASLSKVFKQRLAIYLLLA